MKQERTITEETGKNKKSPPKTATSQTGSNRIQSRPDTNMPRAARTQSSQTSVAPSRQRTNSMSQEQRRFLRAEYRAGQRDARIAHTLRAIRDEQVAPGRIADIYRDAGHIGLLTLAIEQGPDKNGLYGGEYTAEELLLRIRPATLLLADFAARHNMPVGMTFAFPPVQPSSQEKLPEKEPAIDHVSNEAATTMKGLGAGQLRKRERPVTTASTSNENTIR